MFMFSVTNNILFKYNVVKCLHLKIHTIVTELGHLEDLEYFIEETVCSSHASVQPN